MRKCTKCGQEKELSLFRAGRKTCKSCLYAQDEVSHSKPSSLYNKYKYDAKRRNIPFLISLDEFISYPNKCFYCKEILNKISLDRIDNSLGYEKDNIVSCCKKCNFLKGSLNTKEFFDLIKKINKAQGFNND